MSDLIVKPCVSSKGHEVAGLLELVSRTYEDSRGFVYEAYNEAKFLEAGISFTPRQCNVTRSVGTSLRGLHFAAGGGEAKLVRCISGKILDVAVDIRRASTTFGEWCSVELSEEENNTVFIPAGFAHGFYTKSFEATVMYHLSATYDAKAARGIFYLDETLAIDWGIEGEVLLSERDKNLPAFLEVFS